MRFHIDLLLVYILFLLIGIIYGKGVYFVEERNGQTFAEPVNSDPDVTAQQLSTPIMELLNLNFETKPTQQTTLRKKRSERASNYMSILYQQIEEESDSLNDDFWIQADRIVSSTPTNVKLVSNIAELSFPLEDFLGKNEVLLGAQLVLYAQNIQPTQPLQIQLVNSGKNGDLPLNLFGATSIVNSKGPAIFNITQLMAFWTYRAEVPNVELKFEDSSSSLNSLGLDVFIVAAFRDTNSPPISPAGRRRTKRQVDPIKEDRFTQAMHPNTECHKQGLYVDFAALNWKEWVIAPEGYAAFYCTGACSFPPHAKMNATSHAIVQTLVHTVRPNQTEAAKCAPRELASMKILFIDNNRNVVMKRYKDMVVQECGCH